MIPFRGSGTKNKQKNNIGLAGGRKPRHRELSSARAPRSLVRNSSLTALFYLLQSLSTKDKDLEEGRHTVHTFRLDCECMCECVHKKVCASARAQLLVHCARVREKWLRKKRSFYRFRRVCA
ncbi:unnamed protein product [Ixodes pacificus]